MLLRLAPGPKLELAEPYDFTTLAVLRTAGTDDSDVDTLGRRDGHDVFIDRDVLLHAGPEHDSSWVAGLDAMIAAVQPLGWVDDTGAVRAHVEVR